LLEAVPQSGDADGHLQLLKTSLLKFPQGQVRSHGNPMAQGSIVLFQPGAPVTADLLGMAHTRQTVLLPKPLHAFAADAKTPANFTRALSALSGRDDS
jgi:hypothetical protein